MSKKEKTLNQSGNSALHKTNVSGSFNVGDEVELKVYPEYCCDLCGEVVHNHIDCPVCKSKYAETDKYLNLCDGEKELTCGECETTFAITTSDNWYYDCKVKIVSLGKNCY